ncbi:MAG TPA: ATP-binding protein [Blastocatellia bacterium]|nr:ATP-binding protein [Blastocatellia bacterium]
MAEFLFSKSIAGAVVGPSTRSLIGWLALTIWVAGLESLKSLATIPPATVFCFALTISSLSLWRLSQKSLSKRRSARYCGALVALAGLLTLSQYLGAWDIPITLWFFRDEAGSPLYLTRMSFNNALCFTFTGFALVWLRSEAERKARIAQLLSLTSGFGAMTTIIGSLYGAPDSIGFFSFTRAATYSAITILALNVVALATQEGGGLIASFVSRGPEGILARRLALGGGLTLVAVGFLTEWGERASVVQPQAQNALLIVSGMAILAALVWQAMRDISRLDVTRSRAEAALRRSEERYRAVSELTSDYVYEYGVATNGQLTLEEVTAAFTRITGFSPEESRDRGGWKSHVFSEDQPLAQRRLQRLLAGEEDVSEYRIVTRDGETRWLRDYGRAVWDEAAGRVTRIYGAVEDITDRKLAEERLRESEARYSYIFETAGVSIWEEDVSLVKSALDELRSQGVSDFRDYFARRPEFAQQAVGMIKVIDVNDETLRMLRARDKDELISSFCQTFTPESMEVFIDNLVAFAEGRRSFTAETVFQTLRGDRLDAIITISYPPPAENIAHALVSVTDITERKRAEIERERLYEQERAARAEAERMRAVAEAANRSKDEFLTMISHELRSPLNIVLGYTRLLRSSPNDGEFVAQAASIIERNAKAQLQIVEDLLDSARVITGRLRLEAQPTDLTPVIEAALDAIHPAAESKGVELIAHFGPQPEIVLGDADRLQQIVWNLLSNAVKFTPEGGRVELRMKSDAERIRIIVSDNGEGIEPEFLPYVFDRFRQADTSVTRRFGGLGLGLSMVKQLTELHGGTISAASEGSGRGATFVVTLPGLAMQPGPAAPPQRGTPARDEVRTDNAIPLDTAPSLDGALILIVDDQEEARALLRLAIEGCGAQVMAVSSGVEALAVLSDPPGGVRPDALILDIAMPEEDGYAVLQKVRELEAEMGVPQSEQIPAIALTAFGRSEDRLRALAAGFRMHVAKPVEPLELAIVVYSVIGARPK